MPKTTAPATPALSFASIFAADCETKRLDFEVEGKPGFVTLRKLSFGDSVQYATVGTKFAADGTVAETDGEKKTSFLISRTVTDWLLYLNVDGALQATPPPDGKRERILWLERNIADMDGDFGGWLTLECMRINGMLPDQEKNSSTPSSD